MEMDMKCSTMTFNRRQKNHDDYEIEPLLEEMKDFVLQAFRKEATGMPTPLNFENSINNGTDGSSRLRQMAQALR